MMTGAIMAMAPLIMSRSPVMMIVIIICTAIATLVNLPRQRDKCRSDRAEESACLLRIATRASPPRGWMVF
jgi:hypothetical protein